MNKYLRKNGKKIMAVMGILLMIAFALPSATNQFRGGGGAYGSLYGGKAKLTERERHSYVAGYQLAIAHVGVGNHDEALRWLERAFEQRAELGNLNRGGVYWLKPLRADPRYQEMLRRLRFPG